MLRLATNKIVYKLKVFSLEFTLFYHVKKSRSMLLCNYKIHKKYANNLPTTLGN